MARVSLIERARARTRREASTGAPITTREAQALRSILRHHGTSVGALVGNPAMFIGRTGPQAPIVGNPTMHMGNVGRPAGGQMASPVLRQYAAGYVPAMNPPGYPAPGVLFRQNTGVGRPAGSTRRRALARMASVGSSGCGCKAIPL